MIMKILISYYLVGLASAAACHILFYEQIVSFGKRHGERSLIEKILLWIYITILWPDMFYKHIKSMIKGK